MAFLRTVAAAISLTNNNGTFKYDSSKYIRNQIPMIDTLYFMEKLDSELSKKLKAKGLPEICSKITFGKINKANHSNNDYDFDMVGRIIPEVSIALYEDSPSSDIAVKEFQKNGNSLVEKYETYLGMDKILNDKRVGLTDKELLEIRSSKQKFVEFYSKFGFIVDSIPVKDQERFPEEVLKILYCETILNNSDYGEKAMSFETFTQCYAAALKDLENNMQCVQKPSDEDEKQNNIF